MTGEGVYGESLVRGRQSNESRKKRYKNRDFPDDVVQSLIGACGSSIKDPISFQSIVHCGSPPWTNLNVQALSFPQPGLQGRRHGPAPTKLRVLDMPIQALFNSRLLRHRVFLMPLLVDLSHPNRPLSTVQRGSPSWTSQSAPK